MTLDNDLQITNETINDATEKLQILSNTLTGLVNDHNGTAEYDRFLMDIVKNSTEELSKIEISLNSHRTDVLSAIGARNTISDLEKQIEKQKLAFQTDLQTRLNDQSLELDTAHEQDLELQRQREHDTYTENMESALTARDTLHAKSLENAILQKDREHTQKLQAELARFGVGKDQAHAEYKAAKDHELQQSQDLTTSLREQIASLEEVHASALTDSISELAAKAEELDNLKRVSQKAEQDFRKAHEESQSRCSKLAEQLAAKESVDFDNQELTKELDLCRASWQKSDLDRKSIQDQLRAHINRLPQDLETAKQEEHDKIHEQEVQPLRAQLEALQCENTELKRQNEEFPSRITAAERESCSHVRLTEVIPLQNQVQTLQVSKDKLVNYEKDIPRLLEEARGSTETLVLTRDVVPLQNENVLLKAGKIQAENLYQNLQTTMSNDIAMTKQEVITQMRMDEVNPLRLERNKLKIELQTLQGDISTQIDLAKVTERERIEVETIQPLREQQDDLKNYISKAQDDIKSLRDSFIGRATQVAKMNQVKVRKEEVEPLQARVANLETRIQALNNARLDDLQSATDETRKEIEAEKLQPLRSSLQELREEHEQLTRDRVRILTSLSNAEAAAKTHVNAAKEQQITKTADQQVIPLQEEILRLRRENDRLAKQAQPVSDQNSRSTEQNLRLNRPSTQGEPSVPARIEKASNKEQEFVPQLSRQQTEEQLIAALREIRDLKSAHTKLVKNINEQFDEMDEARNHDLRDLNGEVDVLRAQLEQSSHHAAVTRPIQRSFQPQSNPSGIKSSIKREPDLLESTSKRQKTSMAAIDDLSGSQLPDHEVIDISSGEDQHSASSPENVRNARTNDPNIGPSGSGPSRFDDAHSRKGKEKIRSNRTDAPDIGSLGNSPSKADDTHSGKGKEKAHKDRTNAPDIRSSRSGPSTAADDRVDHVKASQPKSVTLTEIQENATKIWDMLLPAWNITLQEEQSIMEWLNTVFARGKEVDSVIEAIDKNIVGPVNRIQSYPPPCIVGHIAKQKKDTGVSPMTRCHYCRELPSHRICGWVEFAPGVATGFGDRVGIVIPSGEGRKWNPDATPRTVPLGSKNVRWILRKRKSNPQDPDVADFFINGVKI